jgi:hypothetical protein
MHHRRLDSDVWIRNLNFINRDVKNRVKHAWLTSGLRSEFDAFLIKRISFQFCFCLHYQYFIGSKNFWSINKNLAHFAIEFREYLYRNVPRLLLVLAFDDVRGRVSRTGRDTLGVGTPELFLGKCTQKLIINNEVSFSMYLVLVHRYYQIQFLSLKRFRILHEWK